jgi:protein-S-isoprenylcysteine O-methyltransferase Ste14
MVMHIAGHIIFFSWIIFLVYWMVSAQGVKRDAYKESVRWRYVGIAIVLIVIFGSGVPFFHFPVVPQGIVMSVIAAIFCVIGLSIAIWARMYLGGNWSSHPALKEDHELVTSGPYRFVRHPIYAGVILAAIGSMLVSGVAWVVALLFFCAMFISRVKVEERLMTQQFPNQYPAYKEKTKAIVPFLW